jgi:hypothetical protein
MTMWAKLLGLGIAVAAISAAYAAAASLPFGSAPIAAGTTPVTACTGLSSLSATRDVNNAGNVTQVDVGSIPAACAGETLSVTLVGSGNAALGTATGTVPAGGGTMSFTSFGGTVSAASLLSYRFAVVGA